MEEDKELMHNNHNNLSDDPLEILKVIDRLEVGPIRIEPRRLITPYTLTQGERTDSVNLIFRYQEDVFSLNDPKSHNLASMMSVQVAINYGLFCNEIVFHGSFDAPDRHFIHDMASNTAREIFVKKICVQNPFLRGPVTELIPVKLDTYLQSELIFSEALHLPDKTDAPDMDITQHAVLSSGGKESLLSFGLVREIGVDAHPIFINESGRHWFTALNAYRYFSDTIPNTSRVWTNADRVFNWILKRLPFIRRDFSRIRSDEYPIRLWTVAVLIFGALPILRKRKTGRLIVGDEFDTTRRSTYKGISHYDGLYDQSRYFDDAITRYFYSKGWNISQFSILRPLSELLIEKILTTRYPELQRHQVSCHAAHKQDERVLPCGRCEKCRRIVGILSAIGADPVRCGYTQTQIDSCLKTLSEKGIHLMRDDVQQIGFLLQQNHLLKGSAIGSVRAQERSHVMKLRFDPERAPMEGIPQDIREPLYRIYLDHSEGVVARNGRMWVDIDLFDEPAMKRPYPFEKPLSDSLSLQTSGTKDRMKRNTSFVLGEMTWPEAKKLFQKVDVALLPVGSIEQHGPHLPLDTDAFDAQYLAHRVAEACSDPKPMVLPPILYGVSYHHEDFHGTIGISPETLSQLAYEIGMSSAGHGITKLVIINGHGGNSPALHLAAQMINRDAHIFTCVDTGETSDHDI
ncbi:MAG: creatininase family protein, partial [Thermodesulfobacteriota bacterium]|nr:creatininase family protein [Thermodesulfobacteriota bacterium]